MQRYAQVKGKVGPSLLLAHLKANSSPQSVEQDSEPSGKQREQRLARQLIPIAERAEVEKPNLG